MGGRGRCRRGRADAAGVQALPLHRLSRPARRLGAASGAARRRRPAPDRGRRRARGDAPDAAWPVSGHRRGGRPARRAARPAYPAPARRPRRDPGADRGRPARCARAGRPPPGLRPFHPAGQPARHPARADGCPAGVVRARPAAERHPVPRAQPVARLRGRLPPGPRLHPAAGGRNGRTGPGAARRGPAQPRARERRRPSSASPARAACWRSATSRPATAGPARRPRSAWCSASRRCA